MHSAFAVEGYIICKKKKSIINLFIRNDDYIISGRYTIISIKMSDRREMSHCPCKSHEVISYFLLNYYF